MSDAHNATSMHELPLCHLSQTHWQPVKIMAGEIDYDEAGSLLRSTWEEVNERGESRYINDYIVRQGLRQVIRNDEYATKTFKYMLLTNVLAKAVNPNVHYRALKAKGSSLSVSFNSGGLATEVVTDWEKDNGQRLGGSNEPRTNKPYFTQSEVGKSYDARNQEVYDTMYEVLSELEEKTGKGILDPQDVLKQALYEVSCVQPSTVDYTNPPEVPYLDLESAVEEYLVKSNLGERLAAITAGVIDAQYFIEGEQQVHIKADHVNVSDKKSNAAGDIEVFRSSDEEELIKAIEVKDKRADKTDIQHSITAARRHKLDEYLFVAGKGFKPGEESRARAEIDDAPIEVLILTTDDLISSLKFQGRSGRRRFREAVGEYLNEMRAQGDSKNDWKRLVESLGAT